MLTFRICLEENIDYIFQKYILYAFEDIDLLESFLKVITNGSCNSRTRMITMMSRLKYSNGAKNMLTCRTCLEENIDYNFQK